MSLLSISQSQLYKAQSNIKYFLDHASHFLDTYLLIMFLKKQIFAFKFSQIETQIDFLFLLFYLVTDRKQRCVILVHKLLYNFSLVVNMIQPRIADAAVLKNYQSILASVTDIDLIVKEFSKHEKCYLEYTRITRKKSANTSTVSEKVTFNVILMLSVK